MRGQLWLAVAASFAMAACSSNNKTIDAHVGDAAHTADARVDAHLVDAKIFMDAHIPSTIIVTPNCTGIASGDIQLTVTAGATIAFAPTSGTIAAGKYVMFTSTSDHNMINQVGAPPASLFRSGDIGAHVACLQFTVAGTYPWMCEMHGLAMTGTLTVN